MQVARPAVASPFTVTGEAGTSVTLTPEQIATVLAFRPGSGGELIGEVNPAALEQAAGTAFAASEQPGRDASIDFATGGTGRRPVAGRARRRLRGHPVATGPGADRRRPAEGGRRVRREARRADHREAEGARHHRADRRVHHRAGSPRTPARTSERAAEQINGKIVQPGETFSLNRRDRPPRRVQRLRRGRDHRGRAPVPRRRRRRLADRHHARTTPPTSPGMTTSSTRSTASTSAATRPAREATVFDEHHRPQVPQRRPDRGHDPDGLDAVRRSRCGSSARSTTRSPRPPGPRTNPTEPKTVTIPPRSSRAAPSTGRARLHRRPTPARCATCRRAQVRTRDPRPCGTTRRRSWSAEGSQHFRRLRDAVTFVPSVSHRRRRDRGTACGSRTCCGARAARWRRWGRPPPSPSCSRSLAEHNVGALPVVDGDAAGRHRVRARHRAPAARSRRRAAGDRGRRRS